MALTHVTRFKVRYPRTNSQGEHVIADFWLEERAAAALVRARDHLDTLKPGEQLVLTDAGRTYAQQAALRAAKPTLAARPGTSWHEAGIAIDLDTGHLGEALANVLHQYDPASLNTAPEDLKIELRQLFSAAMSGRQALLECYMKRFGWTRPLSWEPWHFEHNAAKPASGRVMTAIQYVNNVEGR